PPITARFGWRASTALSWRHYGHEVERRARQGGARRAPGREPAGEAQGAPSRRAGRATSSRERAGQGSARLATIHPLRGRRRPTLSLRHAQRVEIIVTPNETRRSGLPVRFIRSRVKTGE